MPPPWPGRSRKFGLGLKCWLTWELTWKVKHWLQCHDYRHNGWVDNSGFIALPRQGILKEIFTRHLLLGPSFALMRFKPQFSATEYNRRKSQKYTYTAKTAKEPYWPQSKRKPSATFLEAFFCDKNVRRTAENRGCDQTKKSVHIPSYIRQMNVSR